MQIAKHLGATVIATCGGASAEAVKALGASQTIDYRTQAFEEVLADNKVRHRGSLNAELECSWTVFGLSFVKSYLVWFGCALCPLYCLLPCVLAVETPVFVNDDWIALYLRLCSGGCCVRLCGRP